MTKAIEALGINPALVAEFGVINAVEHALVKKHGRSFGDVSHHFIPGHYLRQVRMPAGTLGVSLVHESYNPYTVVGHVSVYEEQSGAIRHILGTLSSVTVPGTHRLLYCHADTVWTTMHATDETDVGKLVSMLTSHSNNPLLKN